MAVDFDCRGKRGALIHGANVREISVALVVAEIDHVQDAFAVDHDLRLNSTVRNSNRAHRCEAVCSHPASSGSSKERDRQQRGKRYGQSSFGE